MISVEAEHYAKRDAADFYVMTRTDPEKHAAVAAFVEAFLLDFDVTADARRRSSSRPAAQMLFDEAARRSRPRDGPGATGSS